MTGFDITLIVICLVFIFLGFIRGLLRQAVILVSWIAAIIFASLFTPFLANYFQPYINDDMSRVLTAFFIIFILIWLVGVVVKIIVMGISEQSGVNMSRRGISAVLGFIQGFLICLMIVFILMNTQYATSNWYNSSRLLPLFSNWASDIQASIMKDPRSGRMFSHKKSSNDAPQQHKRNLLQLLGGG